MRISDSLETTLGQGFVVVPKVWRLMLAGEKPSSTLRKREQNLKQRGCWVKWERELLSEEGSFQKCNYS